MSGVAVGAGASAASAPPGPTETDRANRAQYGPALALTVTLAFACFMLVMPAFLLVVHPVATTPLLRAVIGQNQTAKTALYLIAFVVILPASALAGPRLADALTGAYGARSVRLLSVLPGAGLCAVLIVVRLIPGGAHLGALLAGSALWWVLAGVVLLSAARGRLPTRRLEAISAPGAWLAGVLLGALLLGALLCTVALRGLSAAGLTLGGAVLVVAAVAYGRVRLPVAGRRTGALFDVVVLVLLLLAIPNVVVFISSSAPPNVYFEPGIIQFQQDWILGPTNQLLHGGALLVNVPSSQYGVGLVYFLAAWFHLAPIGYGTFGLLDGILTALFYAGGYAVLRLAGVRRLLAASALAFAVLAFAYHLHFAVGELPEQGPLRFGMPMLVILGVLVAARRSRWGWLAPVVVGVSSIWAIEAFVYSAFTYAAMVVMGAWLRPRGARLRRLWVELASAAGACLGAQLLLALATLIATGNLPHWDQYLAYVHGLLLGGREGSITYGFEVWSPGLAVGALCLASAAALVLLPVRSRRLAARDPVRVLALTGVSAYAIATFSYADNRSSSYLLLYLALPILMIVVLWLDWLLAGPELSRPARRGALVLVAAVGVVVFAAAWPAIGSRFSRSALAHAYPGGGLRASLHRLWHPPPIDPRAPAGQRLLARYLPGKRPLILLPDDPDLALEVLMRSGRASPLFVGDPSEDAFIPSVWVPKVAREIEQLRAGERLLTDRAAGPLILALRGRGAGYALAHPLPGGNPQVEWILAQIDRRFALRPVHTGPDGFVVDQLELRGG